MDNSKETVLTINDFIAGWLGGMCGLIVGHPLDTIKLRQQTSPSPMTTIIKKTLKYEGVRGFFKGMSYPLLTAGPTNAIFFGIYGNVMHIMQHNKMRQRHFFSSQYQEIKNVFLAGCIAGFGQTIFTCPIELIKTNLQAQWKNSHKISYSGPYDVFKRIKKSHGLLGLFRGVVPMMIRDVPTSGLYIVSYELLLDSYYLENYFPMTLRQILAGGLAGVTSWIFVIPLDVIKSRIQAEAPKSSRYRGTYDCFKKICHEEGWRTLFRGFPIIVLRAFPMHAVMFLGYEFCLSFQEN